MFAWVKDFTGRFSPLLKPRQDSQAQGARPQGVPSQPPQGSASIPPTHVQQPLATSSSAAHVSVAPSAPVFDAPAPSAAQVQPTVSQAFAAKASIPPFQVSQPAAHVPDASAHAAHVSQLTPAAQAPAAQAPTAPFSTVPAHSSSSSTKKRPSTHHE
ncbi:hypothetical protein U1Q18_014220, partial [Sarracenia purpurea var. burkii]